MSVSFLNVAGLSAYYGDFQALFDIDFAVGRGETVALIGANGAGKTTFLKALAGLVAVRGNTLDLDGNSLFNRPAHEIARLGIAMVPEGRRLFPSLSVRENIEVGGFRGRTGPWNGASVERIFPRLARLGSRPAALLSGGEQQMVAIARALVRNPRLLILDELSLGLSPAATAEIYRHFGEIRSGGTTVILVEQDLDRALSESDRFYCFREGRVTLSGVSATADRKAVSQAYFGQEAAA